MYNRVFPEDVEKIICSYAWNNLLTFKEIMTDVSFILDIRDSIHTMFLSPIVFDEINTESICSPYIEFHSYYPSHNIMKSTIYSNTLKFLSYHMHDLYFKERRAYRTSFEKNIQLLFMNGFQNWNLMCEKYFLFFRTEHFINEVIPNSIHDAFIQSTLLFLPVI